MILQLHLAGLGALGCFLFFVATQQVVTIDENIARGKPAMMSSLRGLHYVSLGVDGNFSNFFHTRHGHKAWWAVDFGVARARVTRVRIVNRNTRRGVSRRLRELSVHLTDQDPNNDGGPLTDQSARTCAEYNREMTDGEVSLKCPEPLWGRYLFIKAEVHEYFHLTEVEVFDDFNTMIYMSEYRDDYSESDVTDLNNATCQQVTTPESDKEFTLKIELSNAHHSHLNVTAVLDEGDCLDFPATMVYTEGDQSAMHPYHNNPSFCDNTPGRCVFQCDCSATSCQYVYLVILSAPDHARKLCEIIVM